MAKRKKRRQFKYPIVSTKAIDGDSVRAMLDRGEDDFSRRILRVAGIDAPEMNRVEQKFAAIAVTAVVNVWLGEHEPIGLAFISTERPKYAGRMVGRILVEGSKSTVKDLGRFLLSRRLVKPYDGGKRQPWTGAELQAIYKRATEALEELGW